MCCCFSTKGCQKPPVAPRCSRERYRILFRATYSDFGAVKAAFENVYACLGITCAQVGGLLNGATPYDGAAACS